MAGSSNGRVVPAAYPPPVDSRKEFIKREVDPEEDVIEVGVAIVGGGTAGLACANRLLQLLADERVGGPEVMERLGEVPVAVIEKAKTCGGHNLSGAVMRRIGPSRCSMALRLSSVRNGSCCHPTPRGNESVIIGSTSLAATCTTAIEARHLPRWRRLARSHLLRRATTRWSTKQSACLSTTNTAALTHCLASPGGLASSSDPRYPPPPLAAFQTRKIKRVCLLSDDAPLALPVEP